MKTISLILIFCGLASMARSQQTSAEKSTSGIQTGVLGVWIHNESRLSNYFALRSEIGFDTEFFGGSFYDKTGILITPVITLEPRWYYNLNKRVEKGRRIDGNSGNFVSLKSSYHPDWFVISNYINVGIISNISIIPTWGIRRNMGKHFNFEAGFGIGYQYYFAKSVGFSANEGEAIVNLHLRLGYRFLHQLR